MNTLKITDVLAHRCAEQQRAGLSLREIAAWLSAKHGVQVSHIAVRNAIQRAGRLPPPAAESAEPAARPGGPSGDGAPAVDGIPDVETLDRMIADLDGDIERARASGGAMQALATLMRLRADLLKRRAEAEDRRRAASTTEVDAELLEAGRRAAAKLRKLVEAELAGSS